MRQIVNLPQDMDDLDGFHSWATNVIERNTMKNRYYLNAQFANVLAWHGIQWIVYDVPHQTWRPRVLKKWVPKPVTNKLASVLRPITSTLAGIEPQLTFSPASDSPEDVAVSGVATRILEVAKQETGVQFIRAQAARWLTLTGNCWLVGGYDNSDDYGQVPMGMVQKCGMCGAEYPEDQIEQMGGCPFCIREGRTPPIQEDTNQEGWAFQPAIDEQGKPKMSYRPKGALYTEVATIFEMEYDHEAQHFRQSPYALRARTRPIQWAEAMFGSAKDIIPGHDQILAASRRYLDSLAYVAPTSGPLVYGHIEDGDKTLVIEGWVDPCPQFPQGLYGIIAGGKTMIMKPYEYHKMTGEPMRPTVHIGYEYAPGRIAYKSTCDDLLPKQRTRNELESIKILHSKRAANSITFIPDGSNTTKFSGEEGLIVRYTALPNVPAPSRQAGLDTPKTLDTYIEMIDKEMEEISGSVDVLRGESPPGVNAYVAISLLEQKAQQGLSELRTNWSNGWAEWGEQILGVFKEYAVDERTHTFLGENGAWAMKQFTNADLRGAVHITAESGVGRPTTAVARRAAYEAGLRIGLGNPSDPYERYRGWEILGLPEMMKDMELDTQAAAKENDKFVGVFTRQEQPPLPAVRPMVDNHPVHLVIHRRFALSDSYEELPQIGKMMFDAHMAQHMAALQQQQMQQQQGPQPFKNEGSMARRGGPSGNAPTEHQQAASEAGAHGQPARANQMDTGNAQ